MLDQIKQKPSFYVNRDLLLMYHHEQMYDELMHAIEHTGSDFYSLDAFKDNLLAYDKDRLIQLYVDRVKLFLAHYTGRKYYKVAARYIKYIQSLGAISISEELAEEMRQLYPQRRALQEELRGL